MKFSPQRRHPLAFRLLAPLLAIALTLSLLELALRLFSKEVHYYEEVLQQGETARRDSIWMRSPDPVLIYEHRPRYRTNGTTYTNPHGILRDQDVSVLKPDSVFRIIVLGDSITAGLDLDRSAVFPALLESKLNTAEALPAKRVEVLNFAVNGYRSTQEARLLEVRAAQFSPDLVILQYCLNDVGNSYTPTIWFQEQPTYRSHLLRRIMKALKALLSAADPRNSVSIPKFAADYGSTDYWLRLYDEQAASWRSVLIAFEQIATYTREQSIPGIVVVFPLLLEPRWQHSLVAPFHRQIGQGAEGAGLVVIDLLDEFRRYDVSALQLEPADIYHFNEHGHQLAADLLFDQIVELSGGGLASDSQRSPDLNLDPARPR